MNLFALQDHFRQRGAQYRTAVGFISLGMFLTGVGVIASLMLARGEQQGVELLEGQTEGLAEEPERGVVVDVAGAVQQPGVYQLPAGARLGEALVAAGGLAADADRAWVARSLNLAQLAVDGSKVYVPTESGDTGNTGNTSVSVSINSASMSELETLWGVGESRAQAIVAGRPYGSVTELVEKKIIPSNVWEKNKERIGL